MAAELKLLSLRTLPELGAGDLERDFEVILKALVKDCLERPLLKSVRELKLVVKVTPVLKQDGTCDDVTVHVEVGSKAPARIVPDYTMRATNNGGLKFNPASPGNPDQQTLGFDDKE